MDMNQNRQRQAKQGLYRPAYEHDACGVGLVVNVGGGKSHEIVENGPVSYTHLDVYKRQVWGGGFLQRMGAIDFAGGTVVHINAGISALVMAIMLGKREDYRIGHPVIHVSYTHLDVYKRQV